MRTRVGLDQFLAPEEKVWRLYNPVSESLRQGFEAVDSSVVPWVMSRRLYDHLANSELDPDEIETEIVETDLA